MKPIQKHSSHKWCVDYICVPIRYQGGFNVIPGDEIKMQMQPYAVQPCKLYFQGIGNRRSGGDGSGRGGEDETGKKKV